MLWHLAVRAGWDDRQETPDQQALPKRITVITHVRQQRLGRGKGDLRQRLGCGVIGDLPAGKDEAKRQSLIVTAALDLARKAAA